MDKVKEIVNDPAKLEEALKAAFAKMDAEKKGFITMDVLKAGLLEQGKLLGISKPEKEPTDAEKEAARKIADPDGTGKITYEGFFNLMKSQIQKARDMGKL